MTSWANTGSIRGPQGHAGPQGTTGTGINLKGSAPTFSALPTSNRQQGDAYIVQDENDSLYIWNASGSGTHPSAPGRARGRSQAPLAQLDPQAASARLAPPGRVGR